MDTEGLGVAEVLLAVERETDPEPELLLEAEEQPEEQPLACREREAEAPVLLLGV